MNHCWCYIFGYGLKKRTPNNVVWANKKSKTPWFTLGFMSLYDPLPLMLWVFCFQKTDKIHSDISTIWSLNFIGHPRRRGFLSRLVLRREKGAHVERKHHGRISIRDCILSELFCNVFLLDDSLGSFFHFFCFLNLLNLLAQASEACAFRFRNFCAERPSGSQLVARGKAVYSWCQSPWEVISIGNFFAKILSWMHHLMQRQSKTLLFG